ncbi:hypothetical protein CH366_19060 [Leptospira harrisiae]|nr:hypothetical protein CH366_19060 [Leptospira harrisiae]
MKYINLIIKTFTVFTLYPYSLLKTSEPKKYITIILILSASIYLNIFLLIRSLLENNEYYSFLDLFLNLISTQNIFILHLLISVSIIYAYLRLKNFPKENILKVIAIFLISYVPYLYSELLRGDNFFIRMPFTKNSLGSILIITYILWPTIIIWNSLIHIFKASKFECLLLTLKITAIKYISYFMVLFTAFYIYFDPQI